MGLPDPDPDPIVRARIRILPFSHKYLERTEIMLDKIEFHKILAKNEILKIEDDNFFTSLKSLKKGGGSGVRSGSINQRDGSEDPDPDQDPHQDVTDPQHCF